MQLRGILAKNVRRLREEHGLSQEALADVANIDRTYVSSIERERYSTSIDLLERLATALKVTPAELLMRDPPSRTRDLPLS
jgi:transcriptional regulator with XRE-family HTH domain